MSIHEYVWGSFPDDQPGINFSTSPEALAEQLGSSSLWSALALADFLLPAFRSASNSTDESKLSQGIPREQSLRLVSEDLEWIEDVEGLAKQRWNLMDESIPAKAHQNWGSSLSILMAFKDALPASFGGSDMITREYSEYDTDARARQEPMLLNTLYRLIGGPPFPPWPFRCSGQTTTKIAGGCPDLDFTHTRLPDIQMNLARLENKTALVQFSHAHALQKIINAIRGTSPWGGVAEGVCTHVSR